MKQVDEDEQRLRTFCAFYMFHETVNPLEVAGFLHDNYVEAKCIGLTLKNLRIHYITTPYYPQNADNFYKRISRCHPF